MLNGNTRAKKHMKVYSALSERFRTAWFNVPLKLRKYARTAYAAHHQIKESTVVQKVNGRVPVTMHEVEWMEAYKHQDQPQNA